MAPETGRHRRRQRAGRAFNEAGARWPRKQEILEEIPPTIPTFNEAGARWPRKPYPSIFAHRLDYFPDLRALGSAVSD